ncbi:MAG: DUF2225 domain-containing protein [Clostridia bacterium]|mgnify:CR=1 FL=1|nr:DUF2225 domain-containing protein [Clostridia bacterium]
MGLLSGLDQFGLGNLENEDLYEKKKVAQAPSVTDTKATKEQTEAECIFDKSYTCPVCDKDIKVKTVKVGKAKLIATDMDLRPKYDKLDTIKYDIIACPHCGYASLSRYFGSLSVQQTRLIKEKVSKNFKSLPEKKIYSYDDALERYKLALANAIVRHGKASEKAYICLKMAWLVRGKMEELDQNDPDYQTNLKQRKTDEAEMLKSSLEGFMTARQSEDFPMCGMDETTVDYLIAVTAMKFERFDLAEKMISGILVSPGANSRMKDKTRDLRDMLKELKHK